METNEITKANVTAENLRHRREAMRGMVDAGKAMIKACENHGSLDLPEKYNVIGRQVQEFIVWRQSQEFKSDPRDIEDLI